MAKQPKQPAEKEATQVATSIAPPQKALSKTKPARKKVIKKTPAVKQSRAEKTPVKKTAAKKTTVKQTVVKKTPAKPAANAVTETGKTVNPVGVTPSSKTLAPVAAASHSAEKTAAPKVISTPTIPTITPPNQAPAQSQSPTRPTTPPTVTSAIAHEPERLPPPQEAPIQQDHRPGLFVVHITPEMAPVAKVGGLADVVFGLTRETAIRGNHVEIILPKYDNLRYDQIFELQPVFNDLWVPWYEGAIHCTVYFGFVHDRKCFFIEPHSQDNFFNRGAIYGYNDDILRYAFFSRAAMEFLWQSGKHPDIIHCHDWQTALVPVFLYEFYQQLGMTKPRVCLTIHNFKHQGVTGAELLRATGLHQAERFFSYERLRDNHNASALNLLKGGIVYSNFITTVSPRYAFETKDDGQGFGLEPTLHTHHMKYGGVVNGIDYDVWNPEIDPHIPARYGLETLDAKYDNKRALRNRLLLADSDKPIVAFIGRLDPQKGLELVRHAIFYTLERGGQFVLLGSSPDPAINNDFWGLKQMLNDSPDCHLEIGFDEDLAHLIYAGADMMLVPSRFEPCGLTQLIALRYGTIPVVRTIGGLADTVFDKDHSDRPLDQRNGYRFDDYDAPGLESALGRAIDCYYQFPEHFRELMKNAMRDDYSWNQPGADYLNIYHFIRAH